MSKSSEHAGRIFDAIADAVKDGVVVVVYSRDGEIRITSCDEEAVYIIHGDQQVLALRRRTPGSGPYSYELVAGAATGVGHLPLGTDPKRSPTFVSGQETEPGPTRKGTETGSKATVASFAGFTGSVCVTCGSSRMLRMATCETCQDCGSTSGCG